MTNKVNVISLNVRLVVQQNEYDYNAQIVSSMLKQNCLQQVWYNVNI